MRVVGIVGDAAFHCIECACRVYGYDAVNAVVNGRMGNGDIVEAYNGIGPKDGEGNVLGVVFSLDATQDDYCGECLGQLL